MILPGTDEMERILATSLSTVTDSMKVRMQADQTILCALSKAGMACANFILYDNAEFSESAT